MECIDIFIKSEDNTLHYIDTKTRYTISLRHVTATFHIGIAYFVLYSRAYIILHSNRDGIATIF